MRTKVVQKRTVSTYINKKPPIFTDKWPTLHYKYNHMKLLKK